MNATIGRIVHYVLPDGQSTGQHRPAIIVRTWQENLVNLQVYLDGNNDLPTNQTAMWVTSVKRDDDAQEGRTWHWPEREE